MRRTISELFKIYPGIEVAQYVDGGLCQSQGEIHLVCLQLTPLPAWPLTNQPKPQGNNSLPRERSCTTLLPDWEMGRGSHFAQGQLFEWFLTFH